MATRPTMSGLTEKTHQWMGLLCLVIVLSLSGGESVGAHASLLETTPADGQHLDTSPTEIVLEFSETVGIIEDGMTLHRAEGDSLTVTPQVSGSSVNVPIDEELPDGTYVLQWRVISSDSHPISGTVSFTVGEANPGATVDVSPDSPRWAEFAKAVTVALKYFGLLASLGVLLVGWRLVPADLPITLRLASKLALVGLVGIVTELPLAAMVQRDAGISNPSLLWDTMTALSSDVRNTALVSIGCIGVLIIAQKRITKWIVPILIMLAAVLPFAFSGHSRSRNPVWLMMVTDSVHLVVGSVWLGGIILLSLGLRGKWKGEGFANPGASTDTLSRFSLIAGYTAALVIATGVIMAVTILDSVDAIYRTAYGITLLIKISFTGLILGLAAVNRYWLIPQKAGTGEYTHTWLRRLVVAELVILIAIVGVTGSLVQRDPEVRAEEQAAPVVIYDETVNLDDTHSAQLHITQNPSGEIEVHAQISDADGNAIVPESDLELSWFLPEQELGPILHTVEVTPDTGEYQGVMTLPMKGEWRLEIKADIDRFTDSRTTIEIVIPD